ncbi:Uncharacterised protein [Moraxella lacunata]|uniref:Uncharacterized protein n=1 Tax=Moraxella lacunata TaxID=477 RepID=A0A378QG22_MORLA|nr:hypothetical protein [Moraxella lacunata]STY99847.1 Uncharacterised protein [Moraxella lacunata]
MKFEIPQIIWEKDGNEYVSKNTFFEYVIRPNGLCKYDEGKFKECRSVDDAMDWVETVHYPDQVKKYFRVVCDRQDVASAVINDRHTAVVWSELLKEHQRLLGGK